MKPLSLILFSIPIFFSFALASAQSDWKWRNPLPHGAPLTSVVWSGSQVLAVGRYGTVLSSPNGVDWTPVNSGTTEDLLSVAWGGGLFVALGYDGFLMTSPDGVAWTPRKSEVGYSLRSAVWTGTQWVAVGDYGTVTTSSDGITWSSQSPFVTDFNMKSVTWTGGMLVAVGYGGGEIVSRRSIVTSRDGISWTPWPPAINDAAIAVHWTGTRVLTVGDLRTIQSSEDGFVWKLRVRNTGTGENLTAIGGKDGYLLAVSFSGTAMTSTDGLNWNSPVAATTNQLVSVAWAGDKWVAVGGGLECVIVTSPDGADWTSRVQGIRDDFTWVGWTGKELLAFGYRSSTQKSVVFASPNAVDWSERELPTAEMPASVIQDGGQLVAVGSNNLVMTSPDGLEWTIRDPGIQKSRLVSVAWTGSRYLAVGYYMQYPNFSVILSSPDGISWGTVDPGVSDIRDLLRTVVCRPGQAVAMGVGGLILTSPDGTAWTRRSSGTGANLIGLVWNGSQWLAVGSDGTILTSPDGVEWTHQSSGKFDDLLAVTYQDGSYVTVGRDGRLMTSKDGIAWSVPPRKTEWALRSVVWADTQFVAVGDMGTILTSAKDSPLALKRRAAPGAGFRIAITEKEIRFDPSAFARGGMITARLFDAAGKRATPEKRIPADAGKAVGIPIDGLPRGLYLLELECQGKRYTKSISLIR